MTENQDKITVSTGPSLGGTLTVPGDKSISHRVAMFSALAEGTSTVDGYLFSEDCMATLSAMEALGAKIKRSPNGQLSITGTGGRLRQPDTPMDMGNSGTSMRLIAGLIAGAGIHAELTGDSSLCSRPMKRIADPLLEMGADITMLGENNRPPLRIGPASICPVTYKLPMASAQVKSCVLLAGLFAEGKTRVIEPAPSRDHTERLMQVLGLPIIVDGLTIEIEGFGERGPNFKARHWVVPGDFSSAAFFIVAAAGMAGAQLTVKQVGLNERRAALLDVLKRMGADISIENTNNDADGEPIGDILVRGKELHGTEVGGSEIPALIDELPLVAVAGSVAKGVTIIKDAAELRVKESDRIAVMVENLKIMGVTVEEKEDGMIITGPSQLLPARELNSYGDHRIAMSMAILSLYCKSPVCIQNTSCVNTSYPSYWNDLQSLGAYVK